MSESALWQCPECTRMFANRNQTHTCGLSSVEHHLVGKPAEIGAIYDAFVEAVKSCGPVIILPEKTRIAFQVRMSFAQLTPRKRWVDGHLVLARRAERELFTKVETFSRRNHLHAFRLHAVDDVSSELTEFIREAYLVGRQEHLTR